jgi:hypothetical protein
VTFQDLLITPVWMLLLLALAYVVRPYFTTPETRRYFFPALLAKFCGAIGLGLIYQFYYGGGDTFNYFTHGSQWVWNAFMDNPVDGVRLIFQNNNETTEDLYKYTQHIWYYRDSHSYFIVRLVSLFDILTFHTYSATALFFALMNFSGMWAMYTAVQRKYPQHTRWMALGILFLPSVVFWGSGIIKDSVTLAALGWMTWSLMVWFEQKRHSPLVVLIFLTAFYVVFSVKVYILLCFVPMVMVWLMLRGLKKIQSPVVRWIIMPMYATFFLVGGYFAMVRIGQDNARYNIDTIAQTAQITAYDISKGWGAREGDTSSYDLGELDGSWGSMLRLMPQAINVSLFRPYLWEVKNVLMLFSALESLFMLFLFGRLFIFRQGFRRVLDDPFLTFCLLFALLFAFAVGVSTANFGTLMRYKIPMIPFFLVAIVGMGGKRGR